ncbi:MAG: MerR family transcriptional regulator [Solirubrobacterales bacterium]
MSATYRVARAAEIVGVSASTLRAWERRYGMTEVTRTESGYRAYDDAAIRSFMLMNSLIGEGVSAREAASEVRRRSRGAAALAPLDEADAGELAQLAENFDLARLERLLDLRFTADRFDRVVDRWLLPELVELGRRWKSGDVSVGGEHMVSEAVRRRLAAEYDAQVPAGSEFKVVLGLAPRARHDLGLLAFATAARRSGIATIYLGADVPVESWRLAAEDCDAVVTAVSRRVDARQFGHALAAIHGLRPKLTVAAGGACQEYLPASCVRLGHEIGPAIERLLDRLEDTPR